MKITRSFSSSLVFLLLPLFFASCAAPRNAPSVIDSGEALVVQLSREGYGSFKKGRYTDAESFFRKALYLDPSLRNVRENLAISLSSAQRFDEAREEYQRLLRDYPDSLRIQAGTASNEVRAGNFSVARESYKRIINRLNALGAVDEVGKYKALLSSLERRAGDLEEARCLAEESFTYSPTLQNLLVVGRVLLSEGLYGTFERFIDGKFTGDPNVRLLLALNHFANGRFQQAEDARESLVPRVKNLEDTFRPEWGAFESIVRDFEVAYSSEGVLELSPREFEMDDEDETSPRAVTLEEGEPVDWELFLTPRNTEFWPFELVQAVSFAEQQSTEL